MMETSGMRKHLLDFDVSYEDLVRMANNNGYHTEDVECLDLLHQCHTYRSEVAESGCARDVAGCKGGRGKEEGPWS
ncbi:hypothetical protein ACH5RR_040805 [Cinchona calisaya]|uniref:Uncharacterized protein n=1 Tax=Cinchona calisaya TaxID=153742 RepID=A0ABD2XSZ0_9GENT